MLLWGGRNGRAHRRWLILTFVLTFTAVIFYGYSASGSDRWPGGSSLPGLLFGIIATLIMLFECALWPRRWRFVRAWRWLGRTQNWLRAHIWLGLLTVPLVVMHSGFQLGGPVSSLLSGLFAIVIFSGIVGLALQNVIPRTLLQDVSGETIYSQIDAVLRQHVQDADVIINAICGEEYTAMAAADEPAFQRPHRREYTITRLLQTTRLPQVSAIEIMSLGTAFQSTIRPFLKGGSKAGSSLKGAAQIAEYFRELRGRLNPEIHPAAELIEQWCLNRRDLERQQRLHWLLHCWLAVHLPVSLAMMLVLALHIFVATKFW